ncbi:hypothetical protein C8R45DRAFT_1108457 [Mycena sanguinolenta]|nr:hypothetical protein C8R45DRAFT_1108457 [Mycena sanguinolenta]
MSLPALDTVTGCLLVGTWASSDELLLLLALPQDDWKIKTLVTVAVLVDTLSAVSDYISVYLYTITHAGDTEYLTNAHWPIPLYGFATGVLGSLVQTFLAVRYWRFTGHTLIALSLALAIVLSCGSVFACSLMLTLYPSFDDRKKFKLPAVLWLVTEVVVDAGIALVLLWEFRKAKDILLTQTRSTVDRLTAITVQSGAAAATLAVAALVSYSMKPESNVYMAFLYPLGHVYVITLLSNLNIRTSGRSSSTTIMSPSCMTIGERRRPPASTHWVTDDDDSCGIHVHRTVHTSVQVSPQDGPPVTLKSPLQSAVDSSPEEIEMMATDSPQKASALFTA